jgi:hypothetical protein
LYEGIDDTFVPDEGTCSLEEIIGLNSRRWRLTPQQISGGELKVDCLWK